jgi:hypothetical protein
MECFAAAGFAGHAGDGETHRYKQHVIPELFVSVDLTVSCARDAGSAKPIVAEPVCL